MHFCLLQCTVAVAVETSQEPVEPRCMARFLAGHGAVAVAIKLVETTRWHPARVPLLCTQTWARDRRPQSAVPSIKTALILTIPITVMGSASSDCDD